MRQRIKKTIIGIILICLISSLGVFVFGANKAAAAVNPLEYIPQFAVAKFLLGYFGVDPIEITSQGLIWLMTKISEIIQTIFSLFFFIGAMLFEIALNFDQFQDATIVKLGWGITRDIANMLFVLILLFIALATIFKRSDYSAKELLPKLIIIALLINFSLVIAGVVIDFSQILTHYFFDATTKEYGFSAQINKLLEMPKALELNDEGMAAQQIGAGQLKMALFAIILGIIIMVAAGLAMALGAFLLIIRLLIIWFLLILAPLAWLCYILPNTRNLFQEWWSKFLKWTFFAPIYVFFVYLALKAGEGGSFQTLISDQTKAILEAADWQKALWLSLTANANLFLQFIIVIGLLFGGLIAGQRLSIYGAAGALGAAKAVGKWTGRQIGLRPARYVGVAAGAGAMGLAGRGLQRLGLEKMGRRLQTRATMLQRKPGESPEHKAYQTSLGYMSDHDVLREAETAHGIRALIAAEEAVKRNAIRTADASQARTIMDTFKRFGATEQMAKFDEMRPDAIDKSTPDGLTHFEETAKRIVREGLVSKLPAVALKDERLVAELCRLGADIPALAKVSPIHETELQNTLKKITSPGGNTTTLPNITVAKDINSIHHAYASITGDTTRLTAPQKTEFAQKAGAEGLKNLKTADVDIALNIPANQLAAVFTKMKDVNIAKQMLNTIRVSGDPAAKAMANNHPDLQHLR